MTSLGVDEVAKKLKVAIGVVTRTKKELDSYEREAVKQREKVERMEAASAEEHDVKKQKEVLEETLVMIPDTKRRLAEALENLAGKLADVGSEAGSHPLVIQAQELLKELGAPTAEEDDEEPI